MTNKGVYYIHDVISAFPTAYEAPRSVPSATERTITNVIVNMHRPQ